MSPTLRAMSMVASSPNTGPPTVSNYRDYRVRRFHRGSGIETGIISTRSVSADLGKSAPDIATVNFFQAAKATSVPYSN